MKTTIKLAGWILAIALAFLFFAAGAAKFLGPSIAGAMALQGYPDWLRITIGVVEICAALILLVPRTSWYAAGILSLLVASFLALYLWRGEYVQAVVPALVLGLVAVTGYLRHPRAFFMYRLRAAMDRVAEREIAAEQQRMALRKLGALSDSSIMSP
jgi:putative oxidoreductase